MQPWFDFVLSRWSFLYLRKNNTINFKERVVNMKNCQSVIKLTSFFKNIWKIYLWLNWNYIDDIVSGFQYGFRKGFNAQLCIPSMTEKVGRKEGGALDKDELLSSLSQWLIENILFYSAWIGNCWIVCLWVRENSVWVTFYRSNLMDKE